MKLFPKQTKNAQPVFAELRGRESVHAEGFDKLLSYSDTVIILSGGGESIEIRGSGLNMRHLSGGRIAVDGRIDAVEYL